MSNISARKELINKLIDGSRQQVIYAEIKRNFYQHLQKQVEEKKIDLDVVNAALPGNTTVEDLVKQYDTAYTVNLIELNYLKGLRKQEYDKSAVKLAEKIKDTLPKEITVTVDTSSEK